MEMVNFGRSKGSVSSNMAFDEALKKLVGSTGKNYIRFYDFEKEAVILAHSDDASCVKLRSGVDVTRRCSGGKPIYVDENVMAYSIAGRLQDPEYAGKGLEGIHRHFGRIAMGAISDMVGNQADVSMGEVYAINVGGMPIAGHAQKLDSTNLSYPFLYHGVIAIGKWNSSRIRDVIEFPEEDYSDIGRLPYLDYYTGTGIEEAKNRLIAGMLRRVECSAPSAEEIGEERRIARELENETYSNSSWINGEGRVLKKGSRFCLLYPDM